MSLKLLANWKLHGSKSFYQNWFAAFNQSYQGSHHDSLGIAPPAIYISDIARYSSNPGIAIGSQNIDQFSSGARTGEIASSMVKDAGGLFSITGHSERRMFFNELDGDIAAKLDLASSTSLLPILCVGESREERDQNKTEKVLEMQVSNVLRACSTLHSLTIAYEPVWAISSDKKAPATSVQYNESLEVIKEELKKVWKTTRAVEQMRFLYGGSLDDKNIEDFIKNTDADGFLVGSASQDPRILMTMFRIIETQGERAALEFIPE